ncbi:MAG TPA: hypothetical protein P5248_07910, partial [Bacteroidales bacterium]|nr:hypothetical protein [Bacteroidales bacterium]
MKTSTSWPRVASYFFNPLLIPSLAFLLLYAQPSYFSLVLPLRVKLMLLSVVFINTALLPLLSLVVLRRIGLIGSLTLEKREERLYPLLLGAILVYLTYFLFHRLSLPG